MKGHLVLTPGTICNLGDTHRPIRLHLQVKVGLNLCVTTLSNSQLTSYVLFRKGLFVSFVFIVDPHPSNPPSLHCLKIGPTKKKKLRQKK